MSVHARPRPASLRGSTDEEVKAAWWSDPLPGLPETGRGQRSEALRVHSPLLSAAGGWYPPLPCASVRASFPPHRPRH